jgi:CDP-glucose 4,6-dehydratase
MAESTSSWQDRRVLVTGCTGFLGGAVVGELLSHGAEVVGLVRDRAGDDEFTRHKLTGRAHVVHGRVEDLFRLHSALAVYEASAVFHLATADPTRPDRGLATVVEAARRYNPRIPVIAACPATPSAEAPQPPVFPPVPLGIARFGEVFGGGDRKVYRIVPATIVGLVTGDRNVSPSPSPPRDFVPIHDAARACVALAEAVAARPEPHRQDLTFRTGWVFADREMAETVRAVFAGQPAVVSEVSALANPLDWAPTTTLTEALAGTISWYREFLRTRFFGVRPATPTHRAAA